MTNDKVPVREGHSAIYDERARRMVVFGGQNDEGTDFHDVWTLDLDPASKTFEQWRSLAVEGGTLPGRFDHVAVFDARKNRMVVFGGWTKTGKQFFGDTWALAFGAPGEKGKWSQVAAGTRPPDRRNATAVYDAARNWLVMFGGLGKTGPLNDVWVFDLSADTWMQISPSGAAPAPRADAESVYDTDRRTMVLYGGVGTSDRLMRDLWELQIQPASQTAHGRLGDR
jgi:hypothetical protein